MTAQANEIFLDIPTPRWAVPLLAPKRLKGAKGGRSSGKSHFYAEAMVERLFMEGNTQAVCIREVQKSLKFSAKKLIENKIRKLKLSHLFEITINEIRRLGRDPATGEAYVGIIIFQGMQDHTAESIKSLEDFDLAWCEEAQSLSAFSLELLEPTIRKDG
ncbi:MAG: phage terminase large subunit, partial [Planctomycetes bacterium]|nr:phage terminase large subunit [Planctomycetota bacterium]